MPQRIFLWFDYTSTGLWFADGDRPAGTVDPDHLALSDATKERLAAWVQRCDDLNMQEIRTGSADESAWRRADAEALALWRVIRDEAGPEWQVGIRQADGVAW